MAVELEFICDTCGRPVEDGTGCLYVAHADILTAQQSHSSAPTNADGRVDIIAFLAMPAVALWRIQHDACRPSELDGYDIAVEQVRTWRDLVRWTSHLMDKRWLPVTNWRVVLGNAADERDRRIVPARVRGDAA